MKIETDIPIPVKGRAMGTSRLKYPLDKLKIGECITCDTVVEFKRVQHSAATFWNKEIKFVSRMHQLRILRVV